MTWWALLIVCLLWLWTGFVGGYRLAMLRRDREEFEREVGLR